MYLTVRIDRENQRFYTTVNGTDSEVRYRQITPELIEIMHVSDNPYAQDISDELLYHAFIFAQKEGIRIIPACDNVVEFLGRHKEFMGVTNAEIAA